MKSKLGILLGSALLFVAACADDKEEVKPSASFTSDYDLGTQVVSLGQVTTTTKRFVDLSGVVTQVNNVSATATTNATTGSCQINLNKDITESASATTTVSITRITGHQQAWILPGSYGNIDNWEGDVNVWGSPAWGELFLNEPNLDPYLYVQYDNRSQFQIDNYLETTPVDLWILETDVNSSSLTTDVTTSGTGVTTSTTVDLTTTGARRRALDTTARFDIDGFIWETNNLNGIYNNGGTNYGANMLVPNSVKVGSTWLDDNGDLVGAVGVDTITVAGKRIRALHVVERGSTDVDATASGVAGWCVKFYDTLDTKVSGVATTVGKRAELNDACRAGAPTDGISTGWVNQRHVWYYKGLRVKETEVRTDVIVTNYGFKVADDNNTPAGAKDVDGTFINGSLGSCDEYSPTANITGTPAQIARLQPFAEFRVEKTFENWEATEIRGGYSMVKEYKESLKK